ncbi:MAG: hypothetical protein GXX96_13645 [Planctomycetaceae bacterium]|nr:hypothetical protein [Planctomycetaceae bacterium]
MGGKQRKQTKSTTKPRSGSAELDRRLAIEAAERMRRGEKPTRDQAAALRRVEKRRDDDLRAEHYGSVPRATWRAWSGHLAHKTLDDLADRFGMPVQGATIDVEAVVRWLYGFLREVDVPGDDGEADTSSLELIRHWRAKREELKYLHEAEQTVSLADVERGFAVIAEIFRSAGEAVRSEYGDAAGKILMNCWQDVRDRLDVMFAVKVE